MFELGRGVIDQSHAAVVRTRWRMSSTRSSIVPHERGALIAERLRRHGSVSVSGLEAEFRISPMTARRDLDELERRGVARRTDGGAVLPGLSSHEDSFLQRLEVAVEARRASRAGSSRPAAPHSWPGSDRRPAARSRQPG